MRTPKSTEQFKAARQQGKVRHLSQTDLPGASGIAATRRSNNRLRARAVRPIDAAQESQADTLPDLIENKPQPPIDPPERPNSRGSSGSRGRRCCHPDPAAVRRLWIP